MNIGIGHVVLLVITLWLLRVLEREVRWVLGLRRCFWQFIPCPDGHEIATVGVFRCPACDYTYAGWYFSRCVNCGTVPGFLRCNRCELSVRNPIVR